ncbi:MAG: hypothetical protein ACR2M7_05825 [Bdellovibrionales bacterium]
MLDDLIKKLPKTLVALIAISIGIFFILVNDPPHKFCDTQIENFQSVQAGILFKNPKEKVYSLPIIPRLLKICRETVSPGACYEYFSYLNRLLTDFKLVVPECFKDLSEIKEVRDQLFIGMETMVLLSWREEVLSGKVSKLNWLNRSDMALFCDIKKEVQILYGRDTLKFFENNIISKLPNSKQAAPARLRKFSILSESCSKYP